jgi:hypothetical protein
LALISFRIPREFNGEMDLMMAGGGWRMGARGSDSSRGDSGGHV